VTPAERRVVRHGLILLIEEEGTWAERLWLPLLRFVHKRCEKSEMSNEKPTEVRRDAVSLNLALRDAAKNCQGHDAQAILTLRSGKEFTGILLTLDGTTLPESVRLETPTGWATIITDEIAAVEVTARVAF
jgi:hypothetical protein